MIRSASELDSEILPVVNKVESRFVRHACTTQGYHFKKGQINLNNVSTKDGVYIKNGQIVRYEPHFVNYSQDSATSFHVKLKAGSIGIVEVVHDGHGNADVSRWATEFVFRNLQECINQSEDIINATYTTEMGNDDEYQPPEQDDAIDLLYKKMFEESKQETKCSQGGSTSSIVIYDTNTRTAYVANLGDSPVLRFDKKTDDNGLPAYKCTWRSVDQDASCVHERLRIKNLLSSMTSKPADTFSDMFVSIGGAQYLRSGLMVTGSIGDFRHEGSHHAGDAKCLNRKPNKYILSWEPDSIWVHGTDGLFEHLCDDRPFLRSRPEILLPVYEKLFTDSIELDHQNLAQEMLTTQASSILHAFKKFRTDLSDDQIKNWINRNWDNHHQIIHFENRSPLDDIPKRLQSV